MAGTLYCFYPYNVPSNSNGYQGDWLNGCTDSITTSNTPVSFSHYSCGSLQLNVALYVENNYIGYVTIGPGQTKSIISNQRGRFSVRISKQNNEYVSPCSCRLQVYKAIDKAPSLIEY
jgi:hypothetical protein